MKSNDPSVVAAMDDIRYQRDSMSDDEYVSFLDALAKEIQREKEFCVTGN